MEDLKPGEARDSTGVIHKITGIVPRNLSELQQLGEMAYASKALAAKGVGNAADAAIKIQAGLELGVGPVGALMGIHMIKGRPSLSSNLMAALVKRSGKYDYRVTEKTAEVCTLKFYQLHGSEMVEIGTETFTMQDAKRAGLAGGENWIKYPANMLFARCLSNGVKTHCPDVGAGMPLYNEADDFGDDKPAPVANLGPAPEQWTAWKTEIQGIKGCCETVKAKTLAAIATRNWNQQRHEAAVNGLKLSAEAIAKLQNAADKQEFAEAADEVDKHGPGIWKYPGVAALYLQRSVAIGFWDEKTATKQLNNMIHQRPSPIDTNPPQ